MSNYTFHVTAYAKTKVSSDVTVEAESVEEALAIVKAMHPSDIEWSDDYEPYDVIEETVEIDDEAWVD